MTCSILVYCTGIYSAVTAPLSADQADVEWKNTVFKMKRSYVTVRTLLYGRAAMYDICLMVNVVLP